jgi:hypothetical protein
VAGGSRRSACLPVSQSALSAKAQQRFPHFCACAPPLSICPQAACGKVIPFHCHFVLEMFLFLR